MSILAASASAHPHGAVDCRAQLHYDGHRLQHMRGELWLDAWHSQRAAQLTRNASGRPDARQMQQFIFALKMQMGRANWLFSIQNEGQEVSLRASADPVLDIMPNGQARIVIDFEVQAQVPQGSEQVVQSSAKRWSLHCADPSYYFVTAFGVQLPVVAPLGPVDEMDASKLAEKLSQLPAISQDISAVKLLGCSVSNQGQWDATATAPRPGMARMDWACQYP